MQVEPSEREKRETTKSSTEEAKEKKINSRKGKRKPVVTRKATQFVSNLSKLFEIGLPDEVQHPEKLCFLLDQRTERKSRLPVITQNKTG